MRTLNQEQYTLEKDNLGIIDVVGIYTPFIGRSKIVSFFEPTAHYNNKKVRFISQAPTILQESLGEFEEIISLDDSVQIAWEDFAVKQSPKVKAKPKYFIVNTDTSLPSFD